MTHPTPPAHPGSTRTRAPELRAAAGRGYTGEWGLFCDYTTATGHPTLPTTLEALTGFLTALPAATATLARRVRAIAAAHRRAGYLLESPQPDGAEQADTAGAGVERGRLIAACPTRGWPAGLWGRRDAFLVVLTAHLELSHQVARELVADDIDVDTNVAAVGGCRGQDESTLWIRGRAAPVSGDARTCATCAVVRWLEVLGDVDGLGRGSARMTLTAAHAPTRDGPHQHQLAGPPRWRAAAQLLPAIDRHGWHDDYRPMTTRALRARLALARVRAEHDAPAMSDATPDQGFGQPSDGPSDSSPAGSQVAPRGPLGASRPLRAADRPDLSELTEVLGVLDELADDADALNARIQALLER